MEEPFVMSVEGHGYRVEVSESGLLIERLASDEDSRLAIPMEDLHGLGEVVERAYRLGIERQLWPEMTDV